MIALAAALFAVLPGYALTILVSRRKPRSTGATIGEAIVWSLLLDSIPAWAPFGTLIPVGAWIAFVSAASCAGAAVAAIHIVRALRDSEGAAARPTAFFWLSAIPLAAFGLMLAVRPIIDWDAVTYYLPVALDIVLSGHTSLFLSQHITTAQHAPNVQPPIMPMLYALAIGLASMVHGTADSSIRLIALVFIAGIWLSTRRIARVFLSPPMADAAGLLYLVLPATIAAVCENPLYLDLGLTFLSVTLIAEILEFDTSSRLSWLRLALIASTAVLMKVDGLPFIVLVVAAAVIAHMPKAAGRIAAALIAAAMIGVSAKLHFFDSVASVDLWLSIAAVTGLLVFCSRPCAHRLSVTPLTAALGLLGLLPAILQMARLTQIAGSPAGYYIPQLARAPLPHWHAAVRLIDSAQVYVASLQPGLPQHFGIGLLLWWGFSPLVALFALAGIFAAARRGSPLLQVALIVLLFELAFLTVFRLDDFRHLMPVTPLLAVLAAYAAARYFGAADERIWVAVLLLATVPFAWTAQQRFFVVPIDFLTTASIDQWHALSSWALTLIAVFCVVVVAFGWFVARPLLHKTRLSTFAGAVILAMFVPVITTAVSPGFSAHAAKVVNDEAGSYPTILRPAIDAWHSKLLLTYKSYGVTWFSLGTARRLELLDATDLARIEPILRERNAREILLRLGIDGTILPKKAGPEGPAFERLLLLGRLYGVDALSDPLLSADQGNATWTYRRFYALTKPASLQAALYLAGSRGRYRISDAAAPTGGDWDSIRVTAPSGVRFTTAVVNVTQLNGTQTTNTTTRLAVAGGAVAIARILSAVDQQNGEPILRAIAFSNESGSVVASFRSIGLRLRKRPHGGYAAIGGSPFILHAADALSASTIPIMHGVAVFHIVSGPLCPKGSPVDLARQGKILQLRAGEDARVNETWARSGSGVLVIRGRGACRLSETLRHRRGAFTLRSVTVGS